MSNKYSGWIIVALVVIILLAFLYFTAIEGKGEPKIVAVAGMPTANPFSLESGVQLDNRESCPVVGEDDIRKRPDGTIIPYLLGEKLNGFICTEDGWKTQEEVDAKQEDGTGDLSNETLLTLIAACDGSYTFVNGEFHCREEVGQQPQSAVAVAVLPMPTDDPSIVFEAYELEGGVPYNGTVINLDVAPGEIEVVTGGPMTISGRSLPGGYARGSIILMLPSTQVRPYVVSGVVSGANWHGSYFVDNARLESTWRALANQTIANMFAVSNCTYGDGCDYVDVIVMDGDIAIASWTATFRQ